MFKVNVRDHVMIAHSFRGEMFGPAQALHGATYVVDATFMGHTLDENGVLVDIGAATTELSVLCADLNYRNLDEHPAFTGRNTTTEVVAQHLAQQLRVAVEQGTLGPAGGNVQFIEVRLHESHVAWASYTESLGRE